MAYIIITLRNFAGKNIAAKCVKYDNCATCYLNRYCTHYQEAQG